MMRIFSLLIIALVQGAQSDTCTYGYIPDKKGCQECGKTYFKQNARSSVGIVGGNTAVPGSWPAQVLIVQSIKTTLTLNDKNYDIVKSFVCGGTILTKQTILTAGHCVVDAFDVEIDGKVHRVSLKDPFDPKQFSVYVGTFDLDSLNKAPSVKMDVKNVIRHPEYDTEMMFNDIALYTLSKPVEINEYVQPGCLPNSAYGSYPPANSTVFAAGWGTLSSGGKQAKQLQNVRITAYEPSLCSLVLPRITKKWETQICAGEYEGGKDTCQGDSGGALWVYDSKLDKYVVIGITSYGEGCAEKKKPGYVFYHFNFYNKCPSLEYTHV